MNNLFFWFAPFLSYDVILIMIRIFSLLIYSNILNYININDFYKFFLIYLVSNLFSPFIFIENKYHFCTLGFLGIALHQLFIGMLMGIAWKCVTACIFCIGEIISSQIGLSFSIVLDMKNQFYSLLISNLLNIFFLFSFFILNFHLYLVILFIKSFSIPFFNSIDIYQNVFLSLINFSNIIFLNAVHFSIPVLFLFLILYIAFMIFNRLDPNTSLFSSFSIFVLLVGIFILRYFIYNLYFFSSLLINNLLNYLSILFFKTKLN
ncbi:flagellar biosynthetic protein FliR [Buchnera aphidicola]|uniref:Flagellar biosynthetic protein FliR n=1 Tax=Buchnera aphidicola (Cinara strobi) TaxID=1921549 RepID=A0A3B1E7N3_9GAMM|nr:flagellar biosynthetic protein FliR [Buchnera aphidicola]VAX76277.1 Flagellar biosynthetic protein FliR [Buchnera aphidicola (Cinara strobi)]